MRLRKKPGAAAGPRLQFDIFKRIFEFAHIVLNAPFLLSALIVSYLDLFHHALRSIYKPRYLFQALQK